MPDIPSHYITTRRSAPLDRKRYCSHRKSGLKAKGWLRHEHCVEKRITLSRKERIKRIRSVRRCCYRKITLGTHITSIPALQGCHVVQNLAKLPKPLFSMTLANIFWQYCYAKNIHIWNTNCLYKQNKQKNPFWIIYQMNTEILVRKSSSIIIVANKAGGKAPSSRVPW